MRGERFGVFGHVAGFDEVEEVAGVRVAWGDGGAVFWGALDDEAAEAEVEAGFFSAALAVTVEAVGFEERADFGFEDGGGWEDCWEERERGEEGEQGESHFPNYTDGGVILQGGGKMGGCWIQGKRKAAPTRGEREGAAGRGAGGITWRAF